MYQQLCADLASMLLDVPVFVAKTRLSVRCRCRDGGPSRSQPPNRVQALSGKYGAGRTCAQGRSGRSRSESPALEAWVLMTTKTMKETDRNSLVDAGRTNGVPVVILDWTLPPMGLPTMAVLCAKWPKLLGKSYGAGAEAAALALPEPKQRSRQFDATLSTGTSASRPFARPLLVRLSNVWTKREERVVRIPEPRRCRRLTAAAAETLDHRIWPQRVVERCDEVEPASGNHRARRGSENVGGRSLAD